MDKYVYKEPSDPTALVVILSDSNAVDEIIAARHHLEIDSNITGIKICNACSDVKYSVYFLTELINFRHLDSLHYTSHHYQNTEILQCLLNYISKNSSLSKLTVNHEERVHDATINEWFIANLVGAKHLKSISIKMGTDIENILVRALITQNTMLENLSLSFPKTWYNDINKLSECISKNDTLTSLALHSMELLDSDILIDKITANTKLISLELFPWNQIPQLTPDPPQASYLITYINKVSHFLARNKCFLWRNVHPVLLEFALIFSSRSICLPPYILLEIFDWLPLVQPLFKDTLFYNQLVNSNVPVMYKVRHYPKIQLIINVKKSIDKIYKQP